LCDGRLKGTQIPDAGRAAADLEKASVQLDDLRQRQIPHQAKRRYRSSFFFSTRSGSSPISSVRRNAPSRSAT
jgi:hypothetical protein